MFRYVIERRWVGSKLEKGEKRPRKGRVYLYKCMFVERAYGIRLGVL